MSRIVSMKDVIAQKETEIIISLKGSTGGVMGTGGSWTATVVSDTTKYVPEKGQQVTSMSGHGALAEMAKIWSMAGFLD